MNPKQQLLLLSSMGFMAGAAAAAAWMTSERRVGGFGHPYGKAAPARADSGLPAEMDVMTAWRALKTSGEQGQPLLLAELELMARASVQDIPHLLELAGGDAILRRLLIRRWVELDPAGAADWVTPLLKSYYPQPRGRENDVEMVFVEWALKDPRTAMAVFHSKAASGDYYIWSENILNRAFGEDMAAGVKIGALIGPGTMLNQDSYNIYTLDWGRDNPAQAAALLSPLPPSEFRDMNLARAIGALAEMDFAAALALQRKFPQLSIDWRAYTARDDFYAEWARRDPQGMTAFIHEEANPKARERMRQSMASAMADTDPVAALNWAAENLSDGVGADSARKIMKNLTRQDPDAALAYLQSLSAGTALAGAVESFCGALPESDGPFILAKAESLPDGDARKSLTAMAYGKMYEQDPDALLKNLTAKAPEELPDGIWKELGLKTDKLQNGLERVKTLPPEAAVGFVSGLFESNIIYHTSFQEFTQALASLPVPEQRDAAFKAGVHQLLSNNAPAVVEWAGTLSAEDRGFIADQIERNHYSLTAAQKREWVDSLR